MEDGAKIGFSGRGILGVLKQSGIGFARSDRSAPAVYQIGQQLLGLAALKPHRLSVHEKVEPAKGLNPDAAFAFFFSIKKGQFPLHILLFHRLEQIAGSVDGKSVHRVLGIACHKNDVNVRLDFFQFYG